jgi:carbamoyl-phosphate synthase/aspartate carbamoyltransferase/dihydroorotase
LFKEFAMDLFLNIEIPNLDVSDKSDNRSINTKIITFKGSSFGWTERETTEGEIVFQTGMVGYPESLTDPSYSRQSLVLTYPLVGSYGVPDDNVVDSFGLPKYFESSKIYPRALIVDEYISDSSHWNSTKTLETWLKEHMVVGISGIDTREVTKLIREHGTLNASITLFPLEDHDCINQVDMSDVVNNVSTHKTTKYATTKQVSSSTTRVLVIDCGIKNNQLRMLLTRSNSVELNVVPFNYNFIDNPENISYDRVFVSNGPGDPSSDECSQLVQRLRLLMNQHPKMPIFGICLGHQLLSLAAGFKTEKMKYGNRGHNIPCQLTGTERCFITTQNHGYAVNVTDAVPEQWNSLFTNLNDGSNEGIYHESSPWFSVQFHPEAKAGPMDTSWLFDVFLSNNIVSNPPLQIIQQRSSRTIAERPESPKKVLVLGSGGLCIGQSGEFDYSGSQAIKAYREEGMNIVLVNPNIATVQTSNDVQGADKIYFLPVTPEFVEKIIHIERPDCIALSFGGQTGLTCGAELEENGVLSKYGVQVLGTPVESILKTEDRELFKAHIESVGECIPNGVICTTLEDALNSAHTIGYPVLIRSAFALGGLGSGFANNDEELKRLVLLSFANTTNPQVIIDKSLRGWKEVEYEIVRDRFGNCISVCNMENFDPLGVHTGESIVVAPSQTLSDEEYNLLRSCGLKVIDSLGIVGECNIQYALDPSSSKYYIIEINARLSRSSALASKATGYPLAYVAAKLSLGYSLAELKNNITEDTSACFEPSLDYCVVKIPRWDLEKFDMVSTNIDSAMKSVGEGMAISRTFEEALQKALRMTGLNEFGLEPNVVECTDEILKNPTYNRILAIASTLYNETRTVDEIHELSGIDRWFLFKLKRIIDMQKTIENTMYPEEPLEYQCEKKEKSESRCTEEEGQKWYDESDHNRTFPDILYKAKKLGFSDKYIGRCMGTTEHLILESRRKWSILPDVKKIDTVAAEFPCKSNYLYTTYKNAPTSSGSRHMESEDNGSVVVLGSGVYKIGSSVEFDWCSVNTIRELRRLGKKVIMINCNPETVSTDYDEADKLYFDELSLETVLDICYIEKPEGVIVSVGGQIPNNIAMDLHRRGINVIGTSPESIDRAENRFKFSRMLEGLDVDQPRWKELTTFEDAISFCESVDYPCLVRPSYVLSGAAMNVAYSNEDLTRYLQDAVNIRVSKDFPVVISKFIQDAKEIEVDAVSDNGWVKLIAISEHVENAGVHSGDATLIQPPQDLTESTIKKIKKSVYKISQELNINGPFNIQFIAKDDHVKVIECNLRVSRSFPFVSKTLGINFIKVATRIMMGQDYDAQVTIPKNKVCVKVPQFSFNRLKGADILLGVDMKSTGEVACFGSNTESAYLKGLIATGFKVPKDGSNILLSIGGFGFKAEFAESAKVLHDLGYKLHGTYNTANYFNSHNIPVTELLMSSSKSSDKSIFESIRNRDFDLIINVSERNKMRCDGDTLSDGYKLRRLAVESSTPIFTDIKSAKLLVNSLKNLKEVWKGNIQVHPDIDCFTSYSTVRIPGLIDVHVHVRDPGETQKEDWKTCTSAALAGGITMICAMPNTTPPLVDEKTWCDVESIASSKALCDYALFAGASSDNIDEVSKMAEKCAALKMYLNNTHGPLLLKNTGIWNKHVKNWNVSNRPICVHAESETLAALLFIASLHDRHVHVCHVSSREEIELIKAAKLKGHHVTCEVSPHHLFGVNDGLSEKMRAVKPQLQTEDDMQALWDNLDIIDCFATDHAPHTTVDKQTCGCPGFPGLETALPLLLTAVNQGRLTLDDIVLRYHTNPKRIFHLPDQPDTYVELDMHHEYKISPPYFSKCGWSPFEGASVKGCVKRVVIRGQPVFVDGSVISTEGFGVNVRSYYGKSGDSNEIVVKTNVRSLALESLDTSLPEPLKHSTIAMYGEGLRNKLRSVVDVSQFTRENLRVIFELADEMRKSDTSQLLKGKMLGLLFYEPSTRTRVSFESAMKRLGGEVIHVAADKSSVEKGESLEDTVRSIESYCDGIVLRHPKPGSARRAANVLKCPLINGGDGSNSHPTQALLDAYTIRDEIGTLGGICVTFMGDLKYSRTVHSLIKLLSIRDNIRLRLVSPDFLSLPAKLFEFLEEKRIEYSTHEDVQDIISTADVLYVTRIQKERMTDEELKIYDKREMEKNYVVTPSLLSNASEKMCIMHPLPRVKEIDVALDSDPRAAYFRQMENGLYVRMALLKLLMSN